MTDRGGLNLYFLTCFGGLEAVGGRGISTSSSDKGDVAWLGEYWNKIFKIYN